MLCAALQTWQPKEEHVRGIAGGMRSGGASDAEEGGGRAAVLIGNVRLHEQRAMSQVCHARTHAHTHTGMHTSSSSIKVQLRAAAI
jgi:hypothetical protein